jgi:hypothetical protein
MDGTEYKEYAILLTEFPKHGILFSERTKQGLFFYRIQNIWY